MKKLIIIVAVLVIGFFVFSYFNNNIGYNYRICENGFYSKYQKGISDGATVYYDSNNNLVGSTSFWGSTPEYIQEVKQIVGKCSPEISFWKFFLEEKLGL
jgi:hypothetical protein